MINNEKFDLAVLLLISLLLSVYLFFKTYVISMDGAFQFIPMAEIFVSGLLKDAIAYSGQQPLYSFLIAFVSRWVSDFEVTGKLISSFFGILIILPVYFLGKRIFDQKIAFFSALFLTIHPYIRRFSADVLKESTYLFFLALGIWFAWKTLQENKMYLYLFIPPFSAIAYLVRPDGVEVLVVCFFYVLFIKKFSVPRKKWIAIFLLLLSSVVLFLPYIIHLKGIAGEWTLSKTKSITEILGLGIVRGEVSFFNKILYTLKKLNFEIFALFHPFYVFLLFIGLWKKFYSHFKSGEGFVLSFCLVHYVVLFFLILNLTDWNGGETVHTLLFSGRHVLPLLLFSIFWMGEGFLTIYHWIFKKAESHRLLLGLDAKTKSTLLLGMLVILVLAIALPKTLKPQRYERLPEKWAGVWIKDQYGRGVTIFTTVHRIAYYAEGNCEYVDFRKDTLDKVRSLMSQKKALYLAIRDRETSDYPEVAENIRRDFMELNRFEGKGMERIIIYKRLVR